MTDGYIFLVDRKKDMMKTSGFQVWPREIEEVIAAHPAVLEVGVAGVPDAVKGEVAKAWVVLKRDVTKRRPRTSCAPTAASGSRRTRCPPSVEFRTELPKTMVGKVLRRVLAAETGSRSRLTPLAVPIGETLTPASTQRRADARREHPPHRACRRARRSCRRRAARACRRRHRPRDRAPSRQRASTTASASSITAPGSLRGTSDPIRVYARSAKPSRAVRSPARGAASINCEPGSPNRISDAIDRRRSRARWRRRARVPRRHVVERAVRFDVLSRTPCAAAIAGKRADLIGDEILDLAWRGLHLTAAEADEIGKPGMSADGDAVLSRASATVARITPGSPA